MSTAPTVTLGIDLGTTYSCMAYIDETGKPVVIKNSEGQSTTPSVVFFESETNVIVGEVAKKEFVMQPQRTIAFIKRQMGKSGFVFQLGNASLGPEEVSSYILKKLATDAETALGRKVSGVVITVPAYFGINEREATQRAGVIAGLNVLEIINEPTAAAIAYGFGETSSKRVLVYDLGGGTFDVTMIEIKPGAIEVVVTGGDHELGGKDWDARIINYLADTFCAESGVTREQLNADLETMASLQEMAESAKKVLTSRESTSQSVNFGGEKKRIELTRQKFEELTADLAQRTLQLTREMLADAEKKSRTAFDEFLLVGGSTRMPHIKGLVDREFNVNAKIFDPDEAVAKGAATVALTHALKKDDGAAFGLSPGTAKKLKDEARVLRNVCSKSFGIVATERATKKEVVFNLIVRNTTVPVTVTDMFGTVQAGQTDVCLRIMEDELDDKKVEIESCREIGTGVLEMPPDLPESAPIETTFKLTAEGRLEITAVDKTGGKRCDVTIETTDVIRGEQLEQAKERSRGMTVS